MFTEFEEFEISLFSLQINLSSFIIANENLISIINYSYNSNVFAGDYNLELDLLFNDGTEEKYRDENQITFHKYGYKISSDLFDKPVDFCLNYETIIPIKLQNIGGENTLLTFNLTLIENFSPEQVSYEFDQDGVIELFAGERMIISISLIIEDINEEQSFIEQLDLNYNVEYYNESTDDFVFLDSDVLIFETRLLPEYSAPGFILKHSRYGELANSQTDGSTKANVEVYTLENDTVSFSLQLSNLGFNEERFSNFLCLGASETFSAK